MTGVIYAIRNRVSDKVYIGQTRRTAKARFKEHKDALQSGCHTNRHLQVAWDKYGEEAFEFLVLEEPAIEDLSEAEQRWMNVFKSLDKDHGYNMRASEPCGQTTQEVKDKLSKAFKGRKITWGGKISAAKHRNPRSGWHPTEEHIKAMAAGRTQEVIEKVAESHRGLHRTPEQRKRISEALKSSEKAKAQRAKLKDPEVVAKRKETIRRKKECLRGR